MTSPKPKQQCGACSARVLSFHSVIIILMGCCFVPGGHTFLGAHHWASIENHQEIVCCGHSWFGPTSEQSLNPDTNERSFASRPSLVRRWNRNCKKPFIHPSIFTGKTMRDETQQQASNATTRKMHKVISFHGKHLIDWLLYATIWSLFPLVLVFSKAPLYFFLSYQEQALLSFTTKFENGSHLDCCRRYDVKGLCAFVSFLPHLLISPMLTSFLLTFEYKRFHCRRGSHSSCPH